MSNKHTYVTKSEQRRAAKKKKKAKTLRTFIIAAVCVLAVVFGANALINGMYQQGDKVDGDRRTADELAVSTGTRELQAQTPMLSSMLHWILYQRKFPLSRYLVTLTSVRM